MSVVLSTILTDAMLEINGVQLGENPTTAELAFVLRKFQDMVSSLGLNRANIHTVRSDSYQLISGQSAYTIGFDPTVGALGVTAVSNSNPAVITFAGPHGYSVGSTISLVFSGFTGAWVVLNIGWIGTATSATQMSIPFDTTYLSGSLGSPYAQSGGQWDWKRPEKVDKIRLDWGNGLLTPVAVVDYDRWSDIGWKYINAPPQMCYPDYEAPISTFQFYPIPDRNYNVVVYTDETLSTDLQLSELTTSSVINLPPGYQRWYVVKLAKEIAPALGATAGKDLQDKIDEAEQLLQARNRKTPDMRSDSVIQGPRGTGFSWRTGLDRSVL